MRTVSVLCCVVAVANAAQWNQIGDIDGEAADDKSGYSVAMSSNGKRIAIGAPDNTGAGYVRVYDYNGNVWNQVGSDINGEDEVDQVGWSVAMSSNGTRIVIGDIYHANRGRVRVYDYNGTAWNRIGNIDGEGTNDWFGYSVAMSSNGNRIAIGATYNTGNAYESGHVRVYDYNESDWNQVGGDIDGEDADDNSGRSVAMSSDGTRIAIGARLNDGGGSGSGHVRVYDYVGNAWSQVGLDIDGENGGDWFGNSVTMSSNGTRIAIGAIYNTGNGDVPGHVRVYDYNGTEWNMIGDIDGEAANDRSGWSVAMSSDGTRIAIGADRNDGGTSNVNDNRGHVRVYNYTENGWIEIGSDIDGEAAGDHSGWSVAMSSDGDTIAIGAPDHTGINGDDSGHVKVYKYGQEVSSEPMLSVGAIAGIAVGTIAILALALL